VQHLEKEKDSLLARLVSGEHSAANELVDAYYRQIYLFMRRMGHNRQTSEDLTQDCFLRAWNHIDQLRNTRALSSWIYSIAANISRSYWRRHRRDENFDDFKLDLADAQKNGAQQAEQLEQLKRLLSAVEKLSVKLRETVVLHYMQKLSIAEASEAAGVMEGTFKSRLNKALKILKKQMVLEI